MKLLSTLFFSMLVCLTAGCTTIPVSITYRVVDADTGFPLEGAEVDAGWADVSAGEASGNTDESGMVTFMTRRSGNLGVDVRAEGYYSAWGRIWKGPLTQLPPSTFTIPLKRIINPVAMVHHRIETELPLLNEPVGFDLLVGDWVAPHGKGERADMFFRGEKSFEGKLAFQDRKDYMTKLEVTFPHELDGVIGFEPPATLELASRLVVPQVAPLEGYQKSLTLVLARENGGDFIDYTSDPKGYLIRVRTATDRNFEIVESNYGFLPTHILMGIFEFDTMWLRFEYHLNPDPAPDARSLEPASLADGR